MKSSTIDHLKFKFTPTLGGLFEKTEDTLLNRIYCYIYDKQDWIHGAFTTCYGYVPGGYTKVSFENIQIKFQGCDLAKQQQILDKVNEYVKDFQSAKIYLPKQEELHRLLKVQKYFQENIKNQSNNYHSYK